MPRRRMIDPDFWKDHHIATLTRDERLFLIGCINNADDEGRLEGHSAYLKAAIFMYDDDISITKIGEIKESCLEKMTAWPNNHQYKILSYQNSGSNYLFFPNWADQQKPSHPTKSKLPPPPPEILPIFSSVLPETMTKTSRDIPPQSSIGQVSQVKDSLGKVSEVLEDFTPILKSDNDLTDLLTTTLTSYMRHGRERAASLGSGLGGGGPGGDDGGVQWGVMVLDKFWVQAIGTKMPMDVFSGALIALKKYPVQVVARAFVKAARYQGGQHKKWKYIQTILDEEMGRHK